MLLARLRLRMAAAALVPVMVGACTAAPLVPSAQRDQPGAATSGSATAPEPSAAADPSLVPALTASALSDLVDPNSLRADLVAFQDIADQSGGNRATGTAGFERSVNYVAERLAASGYEVTRQSFDVAGGTSWNLLAERAGTGDGVVMLGAHLDSVQAGAGINDNASGVTALLALADALRSLPPPSATVRFAFWGAEEGGPFGSTAYVAGLEDAELAQIRAYLNFDMLASPNGVTFVYDEPAAAPGSDAITNLVSGYFKRRGFPWDPIDLTGDSDHIAFTNAGIPTGGLFAGGIEPVTADQAARYGSVADKPADECVHSACDTLDHVDLARLALMTDAIAAVLVALAAGPAG